MSNSPQFKSYEEGKLIFESVKAEKIRKGYFPLFNYNGKIGLNSGELGLEYYKSQGYEAKFSENDIWNSFFHHLIFKNIRKFR